MCFSSFKKASFFLTTYYLVVWYIPAANLHFLTDLNFENSFGIVSYVAIRLQSFKLFWSETAEIIAIEYRRPNIKSTFFAFNQVSYFPATILLCYKLLPQIYISLSIFNLKIDLESSIMGEYDFQISNCFNQKSIFFSGTPQ